MFRLQNYKKNLETQLILIGKVKIMIGIVQTGIKT